jgi:hypothetical protein
VNVVIVSETSVTWVLNFRLFAEGKEGATAEAQAEEDDETEADPDPVANAAALGRPRSPIAWAANRSRKGAAGVKVIIAPLSKVSTLPDFSTSYAQKLCMEH